MSRGRRRGRNKDVNLDYLCRHHHCFRMPRKMIPIEIGTRFTKLVVTGAPTRVDGVVMFPCRCDCGASVSSPGSPLRAGRTKSCGCGKAAAIVLAHRTHSGCGTKLYNIWSEMRRRCSNPSHARYRRYGGRGVTVCAEFMDFATFRDWSLKNGYMDDHGLSLDRIDNDGGYRPDNCRWTDSRTQARNSSKVRRVAFNGRNLCLSEWEEFSGISQKIISLRLRRGWTMERILATPSDGRSERWKKKSPSTIAGLGP